MKVEDISKFESNCTSGRDTRRGDDLRMLANPTLDRRPPQDLDFRIGPVRDERPLGDRGYPRAGPKIDPAGPMKPDSSSIEQKHKDTTESSARGEALNGGGSTRTSLDPKSEGSYGYPPLGDRYRELPPSDYARPSYPPFEGRSGRGEPDLREREPFEKLRGPRDPYYSSYPSLPPSEYRDREAYPPRREPHPLDYPPRGAAYDERYPPTRGPPVDLDPPMSRGREGFRDLPPRAPPGTEFGTKRKYDGPEYMEPYYDDHRVPTH